MTPKEFGLLAIVAAPLVVALGMAVARTWLTKAAGGRAAGWLAAAAAAVPLVVSFAMVPTLQQGGDPSITARWLPGAGIQLGLHLDWLTLPFLITEAAVTLVAVIYAWGYHHPGPNTPYFYALLLVFGVGMAGTTLADDMVLFYTFWELMLIASSALILIWGDEAPGAPSRERVALKYFIFTHLGSLMVLISLLLLFNAAGSDTFSALRAGVDLAPGLVTALIVLFLVGFGVKMAVFPLHLWLPDAHTVAPMPVTIMLAAAMLSMGTYGILRFPLSLFDLAQLRPFALPMMIVGVISEIYGALMALAERDVKRIIAYSSVSQMGYILLGLGSLTYNGIAGATLHVIYHAIVKALLFMVLGLVIHATGRRQIDTLGGLSRDMPVVAACAGIGALAIAGMPPLCIFTSEWMIFSGAFETPYLGIAVLTLLGSLLTVAYALWFVGKVFLGARPEGLEVKARPLAMAIPTVLLTALAIIEGIFPGPLFDWVAHELTLLLGGGP
jgi:NADH-quinone oxidoreductase subunit M